MGLAVQVLDRFGGDALGVLDHAGGLGDFPSARARHAGELTRARLAVLARRHAEPRRRREHLLLDVGPFARREVLPFRFELYRRVDGQHVRDLHGQVDDFLDERLLLLLRHLRGILLHRRGPVLRVRRNRREPHVDLLRDGAGLGDFGRHASDAADLVLGDDRAAREAPDAAVDHADAEPCGVVAAGAGAGIVAAESAEPAPASAASATPATPPRGRRRTRRDRRLHHGCRRSRSRRGSCCA